MSKMVLHEIECAGITWGSGGPFVIGSAVTFAELPPSAVARIHVWQNIVLI